MIKKESQNSLNEKNKKEFLTFEQVLIIIKNLRVIFKFMEAKKIEEPLLKHVQYPKVPSKMSESLVYQLLVQKELLPEIEFKYAKKGKGDISLVSAKGVITNIEIKATGVQGFSRITNHDIKADFIIWAHFGNFLSSEVDTIDFYIINNKSTRLIKPGHIVLDKFLAINIKNLHSHVPYKVIC